MKKIRKKQVLQTIYFFLLCSAVFFVVSVMLTLISGSGNNASTSYLLLSSLLFSCVIALLFTVAQLSGIRLRRRKVLPDIPGVRPVAECQMQASYSDVVQQCAEAVRAVHGVRSWNVEAAQGVITASIGMSLLSWGESIRIDIEPTDATITVRFSSTPKLPTTLVNYGKNLRNVESVLRQLKCGFAEVAA